MTDQVFDDDVPPRVRKVTADISELLAKLEAAHLPELTFTGVPSDDVLAQMERIVDEHDQELARRLQIRRDPPAPSE